MRKPKTAGEVAVMEVAQSSFAGVRTRAKTLALQRLQKSQPQPSSQQPSPVSSGSYLQLRNRRLEKPPILIPTHCSKRQRQAPKVARLQNPKSISNTRAGSRLRVGSLASVSNRSVSNDGQRAEDDCKLLDNKQEGMQDARENIDVDVDVEEASFGENVLDFEGRERWVSLIGILVLFLLLLCLFPVEWVSG